MTNDKELTKFTVFSLIPLFGWTFLISTNPDLLIKSNKKKEEKTRSNVANTKNLVVRSDAPRQSGGFAPTGSTSF